MPMKNKLTINKSAILPIMNGEHDFLHSYFSNHDISVVENGSHIEIQLKRKDFLYCEDVSRGLEWLNITPKKVSDYYIEGEKSFFTLLESWVTYGIGRYLQRSKHTHITIIHFDDHQDLMSPYIGFHGGKQVDLLTQKKYDFSDLNSVKQAIYSGAITLGSMLTPIICAHNSVDVFHVCNRSSNFSCPLHICGVEDDILFPQSSRLELNFNSKEESTRNYTRLSDVEELPSLDKFNSTVLLHFDMDYFNNRYNGSTDWNDFPKTKDHPLADQFDQIEKICAHLQSSGLSKLIKHTSIGVSPSFYPVEYWEKGICKLLQSLDNIGISVEEILNGNITKASSKADTISPGPKVSLVPGKINQQSKGNFYWHIHCDSITAGKVFINFNKDKKAAYLQIFLNKKNQNRGIGRIAYRMACEQSSYNVVFAEMRKGNIASIKAATAAGFHPVPSESNQMLMCWKRTNEA